MRVRAALKVTHGMFRKIIDGLPARKVECFNGIHRRVAFKLLTGAAALSVTFTDK